jgi:sigma54-dependent transcription regulator
MIENPLADRLRHTEQSLSTHEAVCAERYAQINRSIESLNRFAHKATVGLIVVGFTLICGMAAILSQLVFHT